MHSMITRYVYVYANKGPIARDKTNWSLRGIERGREPGTPVEQPN